MSCIYTTTVLVCCWWCFVVHGNPHGRSQTLTPGWAVWEYFLNYFLIFLHFLQVEYVTGRNIFEYTIHIYQKCSWMEQLHSKHAPGLCWTSNITPHDSWSRSICSWSNWSWSSCSRSIILGQNLIEATRKAIGNPDPCLLSLLNPVLFLQCLWSLRMRE